MAESTLQARQDQDTRGSAQPRHAENPIQGAQGPVIGRLNLLSALNNVVTNAALAGVLMVGTAPAQEPQGATPNPAAAPGTPPTQTSTSEAIELFNVLAKLHNKAQEGAEPQKIKAAAAEWSDFLKSHPSDPLAAQAHHYRGVCLLMLQEYAEATKHFASASAGTLAPQVREETLFNRALAQYLAATKENATAAQSQLFKDASASFHAYLREFPQGRLADQATFWQAEGAYRLGDRDAAIAGYTAVLATFPESPLRADARYNLGVAQQEAARTDDALATFTEFAKQHPEHKLSSDVTLRRADLSFEKGDVAAAATLYEGLRATQGFEHADYAGMRRAACLVQLGKHAEAAAACEDVAISFPTSPLLNEAQLSAGRLLLKLDKLPEATRWLEQAVGGAGKYAPEAGYLLSQIALRQADASLALERSEAALRVVSNAPEFEVPLKMARADALYALPERRVEATAAYRELFEQNKKHAQAPEALYKAAFGTMEQGDYPEAIRLAREFSATSKGHSLSAAAQFVEAESAFQIRDFKAAEGAYAGLLTNNPQHPDRESWQVRLARAQLAQEKNAEVLTTLSSADTIQTPERKAEAHYLAGRAHLATEAWGSAVASLTKASSGFPEADAALLYLSRAHAKNTEDPTSSAQAEATLTRLLNDFPSSEFRDQALYQLGEHALKRNDLKAAYERFNEVTANHSASRLAPFALYQRGIILAQQGTHQEAVKVLTEFIDANKDHELAGSALYHRGLSRRRSGDVAGAVSDLDTYLGAPFNPAGLERSNARFEKGLALVEQGKLPEAAEAFRSVLTDHPDYVHADQVRYELAWAHTDQQQTDEAIAQFTALAKEHPRSPLAAEALYHVGEDHFSKRRYAEAEQTYASALKSPGAQADAGLSEKVVYKLGWAHFNLRNYDAALEQFSAYLNSNSTGEFASQTKFMKGETLFKLGRFADAYPVFVEASEAKEFSELSTFRAAQSAGAQKMWQESQAGFEKLLTQFPETRFRSEADLGLGRAFENTGNIAAAHAQYLKVAAQTADVIGTQALHASAALDKVNGRLAEALLKFERAIARGEVVDTMSPEQKEVHYQALLGKAQVLEAQAKLDTTTESDRAGWRKESQKLYQLILQDGPEALKKEAQAALGDLP